MNTATDIAGRVVLVTGAASGIGRGIAERCHQQGAAGVLWLDLDESVVGLADDLGGLGIQLNVVEEEPTRQAIAQAEDRFGAPVDVLFLNAGIAVGGDLNTSNAAWQKAWNVNVMAHVFAVRVVLDGMLERQRGAIIHTASAAGMLTALGAAPYTATKYATVGLANWLAATYGHRGIRVSVVCPQGVKTPMLDDFNTHIHPNLLNDDAIHVEQVVDAIFEGLSEDKFLIFPHPEVEKFVQFKANAPDQWLDAMQKIQHKLLD